MFEPNGAQLDGAYSAVADNIRPKSSMCKTNGYNIIAKNIQKDQYYIKRMHFTHLSVCVHFSTLQFDSVFSLSC